MRNIRTRTSMSYAFEGALAPYMTAPAETVPSLVRTVAEKMAQGFRDIPAWTAVTRMGAAKAAERKNDRRAAR